MSGIPFNSACCSQLRVNVGGCDKIRKNSFAFLSEAPTAHFTPTQGQTDHKNFHRGRRCSARLNSRRPAQ
ncbi:hypothetical protein Q5P01_003792 [Channa striata]|uniref:Uncharacterized protein n=1 Tax=Channa striata TaxID=64152 RepID=A0AA88T9P8_CHASR|nr:hypothetical protein Q5P01_003792 [Channa striata]